MAIGEVIRLLTVVGARPQFIKAASLSRTIAQRVGVSELILHTGQHYDDNMSKVFFDELKMPPPDLNLQVGSGSHAKQTASMLVGIESALLQHSIDMVVVYGDTNSTVAGALAAAKLNVPVAHIEAGLRSFDKRMPEEINRIVTDQLANLHFCPSQVAVRNLEDMGIRGEFVVDCGDIMFETLLSCRPLIVHSSKREPGYLLTTFHRAENTDDPARLSAIVQGLCTLAEEHPILIPLHPRTRAALKKTGLLGRLNSACELLEPVGFLEMLALLDGAALVITDSGGLQKEAFFMGKSCVVLRDQTEWVELVELGQARLWTLRDELSDVVGSALATAPVTARPYGNGDSARIILDAVEAYFKCSRG